MPRKSVAIFGWLGGIWPWGKILGQCPWHLRSHNYYWISPSSSWQTCASCSWTTSASKCPSHPEPLAGEGLCHEFDLCGSLQWPPEGTLTWVLTFSDSISHTPRTETNHMHKCLPSTALLKQHFHSHSLWSLVFPKANISKRFPCIPVIFMCMTLDCLTTVDSLPLALVILPSGTLIVLLPTLTPTRYCFCLCFDSDTPAAVIWSLPVWPWSKLLKWILKWIHTLLIRHYTNKYFDIMHSRHIAVSLYFDGPFNTFCWL